MQVADRGEADEVPSGSTRCWYPVCVVGDVSQAVLHAPDDIRAADVYRSVLWHLREAGIPYLVGGTYALEHHAGLVRDTKDLDLFVRRADWSRVAETLARARRALRTGVLALAGKGQRERAFRRSDLRRRQRPRRSRRRLAGARRAVGRSSKCRCTWSPAEEMIWSKSFVMERERYDGGDITHILRKCGASLDWVRLLRRFDPQAPVLLAHLVLFQFVYPTHRDNVPPMGHG